jgi:hypothetical protein
MAQTGQRLGCSAPLTLAFAHVPDLVPIAVAEAAAATSVFVSAQLEMTDAATVVGFLNPVAEFPMAASWIPRVKVVLLVCSRVFVGEKLCWAEVVPHSRSAVVLPDLDEWVVTIGVKLSWN